ncbi:MAG: hypothetical protein ABI824_09160 [Acidobacteriota bacterium]
MILKLNHLKVKAAATTQNVVDTIYSLLEEGLLDQGQFARLQIELDWIQYKQNFREVAIATESFGLPGEPTQIMDVHIDTRQVVTSTLRADVLRALRRVDPNAPACNGSDRIPIEDFCSMRRSIVWDFNGFYWRNLNSWEQATGKGYDAALPGGGSDGHNPKAIADDVAEFLDLLTDLRDKDQLPAEIHVLEIGVGSGSRCAQWLDQFQAADQERGTGFYPQIRFHMGDYSNDTLNKARPAVARHIKQCRFIPMDAGNPIKALPELRFKVMQVHLTNVYDNLPDEEVVRRDGKLYFVQVRAYVPKVEAERLCAKFGAPSMPFRDLVHRLLQHGFEDFCGVERGVPFWQELWAAVRLEERLVQLEALPEFPFPEGLDAGRLEDILQNEPNDLRFHLSSGALESFIRTLPLLHPRGYLQVFDIFVTDLAHYRTGYFGPGKLDGSLLNWVNGALLQQVAHREGYDVNFRPFKYRAGTSTKILYTTRRE